MDFMIPVLSSHKQFVRPFHQTTEIDNHTEQFQSDLIVIKTESENYVCFCYRKWYVVL